MALHGAGAVSVGSSHDLVVSDFHLRGDLMCPLWSVKYPGGVTGGDAKVLGLG